jgi:hypothetical protein
MDIESHLDMPQFWEPAKFFNKECLVLWGKKIEFSKSSPNWLKFCIRGFSDMESTNLKVFLFFGIKKLEFFDIFGEQIGNFDNPGHRRGPGLV